MLVVLVMVVLAVEWLRIDELRQRVDELERSCQSRHKHLSTNANQFQPNTDSDQRPAAEV